MPAILPVGDWWIMQDVDEEEDRESPVPRSAAKLAPVKTLLASWLHVTCGCVWCVAIFPCQARCCQTSSRQACCKAGFAWFLPTDTSPSRLQSPSKTPLQASPAKPTAAGVKKPIASPAKASKVCTVRVVRTKYLSSQLHGSATLNGDSKVNPGAIFLCLAYKSF